MTFHKFPAAKTEGLVIQEVGVETLVYDTDKHRAHCLNETAAFVWSKCDGQRSVEDIAKEIEKKYGYPTGTDFVDLAITQLNENGLLSSGNSTAVPAVSSRREMIRKVGLSTALAVPIVASLVAPRDVLSQTSCRCVNPGGCITQTTCPSQVNCNGSGICAP
ncbi:MAG: PqqD family protein [Acidobacteria bacterium]|nr:PqqD family protein [Acidobacteriota bacterium]